MTARARSSPGALSVVLQRVGNEGAAVLVEVEVAADRGGGPLRAGQPFAGAAARADGGGGTSRVEVDAGGVDETARVAQLAAQADREDLAGLVVAAVVPGDGASDPQVSLAIRHCRNLGHHAAGSAECLVDVPQWTCAAG